MSADELGFDDAAFAEQNVELLVFDVGDETYAADAALVLRIDRPDETTTTRADLGTLKSGRRALVFRSVGVEGSLRVDAVRGLRTVDISALRRLPSAAARPNGCAMGIWLDGERAVLLVDLLQTVKT